MRLELARETRPALPVLLDSFRQQRSAYEVALRDGSLKFQLNAKQGDWYIFYECCVLQDYLKPPIILKPGDTVLDIGANFGAFALTAARRVGPAGRVFCYEPGRSSFARIEQHIRLNDVTNVTAVNAAVGAAGATVPLYLSTHSQADSLFQAKRVNPVGPRRTGVEMVEVVGIRDVLARIGGPVTLAKIDCEGSEYDIFDALTDEDILRIPQFAIETHRAKGRSRKDIAGRLARLGYTITGNNPFRAVRR